MPKISKILDKYNIQDNSIINFNEEFSKILINGNETNDKKAKLILVTAVTPTPYGEGKTTMAINICDALNALSKKTIITLREPSMGPTFGFKGGATGGGKCKVKPENEINFHFTGDMHAITSSINTVAAVIDNHIYWGNELNIDCKNIFWKRATDVNDRSLRTIDINISKDLSYKGSFEITSASEIMSILCISKNESDFKERLENVVFALSTSGKPLYLKQLKCIGGVMELMKYALLPNAVSTLNDNLALIHGGPFANISFGCNSTIAINYAMNNSEFTITEAGFGSDLGAEKFINIITRENELDISCIVLVVTIRSLKYQAGIKIEDVQKSNPEAISIGFSNFMEHYDHLLNYDIPIVACVNQFDKDNKIDCDELEKLFKRNNIVYSFNNSYANGTSGGIDLAKNIVDCSNKNMDIKYLYDLSDSIESKINSISKKCHKASVVKYSDKAKQQLLEMQKLKNYYICISKNPSRLAADKDGKRGMLVTNLIANHGTKTIVVEVDNVFRMPGLPRKPRIEEM